MSRVCVVLFALWSACQPAPVASHIEGRVVDPFGQPIAGVKVHVLKSAYATETSSDGTYRVPYAPGAFEVAYRHQDHTTEVVSLHIQVPTAFPSDVVTLYPRAAQDRLFGFRSDARAELTARTVTEKLTFRGFRSARTWRCPPEGPSLGAAGQTIRFIDGTTRDLRLVRLGPGGLIAHDNRTPEGSRYDGWRESQEDRVGKEDVLMRTVTAQAAGPHAWVETRAEDDQTQTYEGAACYPFVITDSEDAPKE